MLVVATGLKKCLMSRKSLRTTRRELMKERLRTGNRKPCMENLPDKLRK